MRSGHCSGISGQAVSVIFKHGLVEDVPRIVSPISSFPKHRLVDPDVTPAELEPLGICLVSYRFVAFCSATIAARTAACGLSTGG